MWFKETYHIKIHRFWMITLKLTIINSFLKYKLLVFFQPALKTAIELSDTGAEMNYSQVCHLYTISIHLSVSHHTISDFSAGNRRIILWTNWSWVHWFLIWHIIKWISGNVSDINFFFSTRLYKPETSAAMYPVSYRN